MLRTFKRQLHLKSFDSRFITLNVKDSETDVKFRNIFLRDMCPSRVDPSTHQKDFSTAQLSAEIAATNASVQNNQLHVDWNDGTQSVLPENMLANFTTPAHRAKLRNLAEPLNIWREPTVEDVFSVSYQDYEQSKFAFSETLRQLRKDGLVFINNVGKSEQSVTDIAKQVGYVKNTFYGEDWNVVSEPQAKNVAYTSVYLPLHMDLLYYESPPGIQLLHVIENSTKGGESVFADSFAAALHVQKTDPEAYAALKTIPLTFHYLHQSDHYYYQRPLVVEKYGQIEHVNYSPPFQGPLDALATSNDISDGDLSAFIRGLQMFEAFVEDPKNQIELHTPEGTCMVFMNRRILHGRRQFQSSTGHRFFKGAYLDIDTFNSKLRTIEKSGKSFL